MQYSIRILEGRKGSGDIFQKLSAHERAQGEVLESGKEGNFLVRLKGMVLQAKSSLLLVPGKTYLFEAESLKTPIELKLISPGTTDAQAKDIFLKALNLPADTIHTAALDLILLSGAIPAKEDILHLVSLLRAFHSLFPTGTAPEEAMHVLFLLEKFAVPVNRETVEAVLSFIRGELFLSEGLEGLQGFIRRILTDTSRNERLDALRLQLLSGIDDDISGILSLKQETGGKGELLRWFSILGILYEKDLRERLMGKGGKESDAQISGLKGKLLAYLEADSKNDRAEDDEFSGILRNKLKEAVRSIETIQILKSLKLKHGGWDVSFVPLPFELNDEKNLISAIYQRKGKIGDKPSLWKLHISLNLESTGRLYLLLSGIKNLFTLRIISDNSNFKEFLQSESEKLPDLVKTTGYILRQSTIVYDENFSAAKNASLVGELFTSERPVDIQI